MIKLSGSVIMLLKPDGSQVEFDTEELQSGIIRSCLASSSRDVWIAEDIALSIEYALMLPGNRERMFTLSDINSLVIKILEETGYPEVAEEYRRTNSSVGIQIDAEYELLGELLARHLGLSGNRLTEVTEKVMEAAEKLGVNQASPTLFVELAKLYKERTVADHGVDMPHLPEMAVPTPWQLSRTDILTSLTDEARKLIEAKIIDVSGVSLLFPSLKIDFRICRFVKQLGLESPLTEMAVTYHFHEVAEVINTVYASVQQLRTASGQSAATDEQLPVYLNINDMSRFSCRNLLSRWPDAENGCREMISFLEEMLDFQLFKVVMK